MTPARIFAPVALVAAAIALFSILGTGSDDTETSTSAPAATTAPSATTKPKATRTPKASGKTYTVKPGDTPSGIAEKLKIDVDDLLAVNPDADPDALSVGDELKLP